MTDSPTGFTYRERSWWLIDPETAPRKVVLAALREAKLEGYSRTNGMGGTAREVRNRLAVAQGWREKVMRLARKELNPVGTANSDFPPLDGA